MTLTIRLRFHTAPGQSLLIYGEHPLLGDAEVARAAPLRYLNPEFWEITIAFPEESIPAGGIRYWYVLRDEHGASRHHAGGRIPAASAPGQRLLIVDSWADAADPAWAFYTEPFRGVLSRQPPGQIVPSEIRARAATATHTFIIQYPWLGSGEALCLLGGARALGGWDPAAAKPLFCDEATGEWSLALDLAAESFPLEYKYGIYDRNRRTLVRFEDGPNRAWPHGAEPGQRIIWRDGLAALPQRLWRGAGVSIPVFSLRAEASFGVGEFADLKLLADWCREAGLRLIQILPVNDTTAAHDWTDSYPYAAISAFALHPLYARPADIALAKSRRLVEAAEPERQRLNALPDVDYEAVMRAKLGLLRQLSRAQAAATFRSRAYRAFYEASRVWLEPYAAFSALRDRYGTADFQAWPEHQRYEPAIFPALAARGSWAHEEIALHCFTQYHLHRQLRDAVDYAHRLGIALKGDIPIGVGRHGADVWESPRLYHLDFQAGAPPDAFAAKGQNWGFPTYNWPGMQADGFAWWRRRFAQMGRYFDAFRIDHILGFFRIWSIPWPEVEGILGRFVPALPVQLEEFAGRGIVMDHRRLTSPFITGELLREVFGAEAAWAEREFLAKDRFGRLSLRPEFATQRQVEAHFAALDSTEQNQRLKQGLFDLISNVILLEAGDAKGAEYHFRFGVEHLSSFRHLDATSQAGLKDLYLDYFFRRQDSFWSAGAERKLLALKQATPMLICGEDLGLVPACVPVVMRELGLLSLEVQRMPKRLGAEFSRPAEAPYLSVVTPSTHDMSTIRGWWEEEDSAFRQKFFAGELGRSGAAPRTCEPWLNQAIVEQHLASPAMWSIFQLQDLMGADPGLRRANAAAERINIPAHSRHYWRYRMHLTLEQLRRAEGFTARLRGWVKAAGR